MKPFPFLRPTAALILAAATAPIAARPLLESNTPVIAAEGDQIQPQTLADGRGGFHVVWAGVTAGGQALFAQSYDSVGARRWDPAGVRISRAEVFSEIPWLVSDGKGGMLVLWEEGRTHGGVSQKDLRMQRVDAEGVLRWDTAGVPVADGNYDELLARSAADGRGGAFVAWTEMELDISGIARTARVFAQRIDSTGARRWTSGGVSLRGLASFAYLDDVLPDGAGGMYAAWTDARNSSLAGWEQDIYLQRLDSSGNRVWEADGRSVIRGTRDARKASLAADGQGGVLVAWADARLSAFDAAYSIYIQRMSPAGDTLWDSLGVLLSDSLPLSPSLTPGLVSDGAGGAIAAWFDRRGGDSTGYDLFAQRVDSTGKVKWDSGGVAVCAAAADQLYPRIAADGEGGAVLAWNNATPGTFQDLTLSASRLDSDGKPLWGADGLVLSRGKIFLQSDDYHMRAYPALAWNPGLGLAVAWTDYRGGDVKGKDIYSQIVSPAGALRPPATPVSARRARIPASPVVTALRTAQGPALRLTLPEAASVRLRLHAVTGRSLVPDRTFDLPAGIHHLSLAVPGLPSGLVYYRLTAGTRSFGGVRVLP